MRLIKYAHYLHNLAVFSIFSVSVFRFCFPFPSFPQSPLAHYYALTIRQLSLPFLSGLPLNVTRSIPTGSSTQLECGLGGRQVWTKDGHSLSVSSRLLVYRTSLWVFRVQEGDEGEYTCATGGYFTNYYLEVLGRLTHYCKQI